MTNEKETGADDADVECVAGNNQAPGEVPGELEGIARDNSVAADELVAATRTTPD